MTANQLGARWAAWTTRRRRSILLGAALAAVATGALSARLRLRGDLAALLPPDARSVRDLQALEGRAPLHGTIIVAIESDDATARARAARQVEARLRAVGGAILQIDADTATRDRFAWQHRYLLAPTADLEAVRDELRELKARANPLYVAVDDAPARDGQGAARLRALKQQLDRLESAARQPQPVLSRDGRVQLVVARTRHPADDVADNAAALAAARAAADEARRLAGPAVRVGIAGDVITSAEEHRALSGGMLLSTVLTTAVVALGLGLFFGAPLPVAALLGALALGALVTFAFAFFAVGHLNLATAFLAPIVVGNGINFGIILLARYAEERRGAGAQQALGRAVAGSFSGTLAAALTASVSYASLLATQFRGFRHFGVIGGVGILCCWAATFLVLPAALAALEGRGWFRARRGLAAARDTDGAWLTALMARRRPVALLAAAALVLVSAAGAIHYLAGRPFETDFKNLRSSGAAIREIQAWTAIVDGGFGRGLSGGTVIALPTPARARQVAAQLRALDAGRGEADRLFARVSSFDELVPADQDRKLALLAQIRRLLTPATLASLSDGDRALATAIAPPAGLRPIGEADVPAALAWPFTEADGTRGRLLIARTGAGFDLWRTEELHRFVARFRALPLGPDLVVGGNAFVKDDIVSSVDHDGPRATLIAALGAVMVVLAVLGVGRAAAVTLIAGATGVLAMLAAAGLLGIRINFLDFVALPITIGIGVDYAVNIAARHRRERTAPAGRILATTGPAVALCSFTTVVGYASLLLSDNRGIRSFGLAALIGELTCVAAALLLAPLLLEGLRAPALTTARPRGDSDPGSRPAATAGLEAIPGA